MRFLKRQTLDRRTANNTTLYSDAARANVYVSPVGAGSLVLPNGADATRPGTPSTGMIRYNTTSNEVEVYQGSTASWRTIRYKEPGLITLQNLGAGDNLTVYFGPLNPAPVAVAQSGVTWDVVQMAKNLIVIVENVIQIAGSNYLVTQNPTISGATYTVTNNKAIAVADNSVYFSIWMTGSIAASGSNGSSVQLNVGAINSGSQAQLAAGQQIANAQTGTVYGTISVGSGGTGTYTLTSNGVYSAIPATTALVATSVNGTIAYPSVDLTAATITTSSILTVTSGSVSANVATLTFTNLGSIPFAVGQSITVTGITVSSGTIIGNFTVVASPPPGSTSVSYAAPGVSNQPIGVAAGSSKVSGAYSTYIPVSTTVVSYTTDSFSGALTSVVLSAGVQTQLIPQGMTFTLVDATNTISNNSYYLQFTEPVPLGKTVNVLHGFDR
jgi:hypothetical protein